MTRNEREISVRKYFTLPLITENVNGTKILHYDFAYSNNGTTILVPNGYKTDFASIPKLLWWWLPPHGRYERAAVIHDYICTNYGILANYQYSSYEAADVFGEAMEILGVWKARRILMVTAVKLLGPKF